MRGESSSRQGNEVSRKECKQTNRGARRARESAALIERVKGQSEDGKPLQGPRGRGRDVDPGRSQHPPEAGCGARARHRTKRKKRQRPQGFAASGGKRLRNEGLGNKDVGKLSKTGNRGRRLRGREAEGCEPLEEQQDQAVRKSVRGQEERPQKGDGFLSRRLLDPPTKWASAHLRPNSMEAHPGDSPSRLVLRRDVWAPRLKRCPGAARPAGPPGPPGPHGPPVRPSRITRAHVSRACDLVRAPRKGMRSGNNGVFAFRRAGVLRAALADACALSREPSTPAHLVAASAREPAGAAGIP